jgi:hypothetical protein
MQSSAATFERIPQEAQQALSVLFFFFKARNKYAGVVFQHV